MNKKEWKKLAAAGVCALMIVAGCSSESTNVTGDSSESTNVKGDSSESTNVTGDSSESTNNGNSHTDIPNTNQPKLQAEDKQSQEDLEQVLADYRSDREKGEGITPDGYVIAVAPNEENYSFGVGDLSYTSRFDTKEIGEAFKAAERYMADTLQMELPLYFCSDPRMTAIYDDTDRGVADGYDADNIFLCEYSENGEWQYMILVREGKGEQWTVLFHGMTYKQPSGEEVK